MAKNKIPLIYSWARSGATVLNKCLVAMGHEVLSELHPSINDSDDVHSPRWQAKHWLNVDVPAKLNWLECIYHINGAITTRQKSLIIRDWTINSFYPIEDSNDNRPVRKLITHTSLGNCAHPVAFVRNAIDTTLSLRKFHGWQSTNLIGMHASAYLTYAKHILALKCPIFYYEDFCKQPAEFLKRFCTAMAVSYNDKWERFSEVTRVLGDTHRGRKSRAMNAKEIKALPRREINDLISAQICSNGLLKLANQVLGIS